MKRLAFCVAIAASAAFADEASIRGVSDEVCRIDKVGEIAKKGVFVDFTLVPEAGSDIRCRIEMPSAERWTGELWGIGSSSQGGFIGKLTGYSDGGHAVATTDLGTFRYEKGDLRGKTWPDAVFKDYSWRATHLMTVYAKKFILAQYGKPERHSYFVGGSCGGRQGLCEAMRFPGDYDGILVFIPASAMVAANAQVVNLYRQTHDETGKALFTTNQLAFLAEAPIAYMKDRDVKPYAGSVLSNPFFSEAEIDGLLSFVAQNEPYLAAPDLQKRMKGIFMGVRDAKGRVICHGILPGARHGNPGGMSFRSKSLCGAGLLRHGVRYSACPTWEEFEEKAVARGGEINATSFDLSAFARRGCKIVVTCGWEDQTTPAPEIVAWYEYLAERNGGYGKVQEFCRLFPLPGVAHGGGKGRIATSGETVRPVHRDALRQWVEKGVAPKTYPLAWRAKKLTLPVPPYPLQCYLGDDGEWKTRRYPEGMVRRPDLHYYEMAPLDASDMRRILCEAAD